MFGTIKNFLLGTKWILLALIVGMAVGGWAGWHEKSIRIEAAHAKQLQEVRKKDAKAVADMQKKETEIQVEKDTTEERFKVITKEVVKYVPKTVYVEKVVQAPESEPDSGPLDCGSSTLAVDAVRLLNAARENTNFDTSTFGDAESQASPQGGIQNDQGDR